MTDELYPGTQVRVTFTCTDETTDAPTDPTTLAVTYGKRTDPTTKTWPTDGEVVQDETGIFHVDVTCDTDGNWAARAVAFGALVAVGEITWQVLRSHFDPVP